MKTDKRKKTYSQLIQLEMKRFFLKKEERGIWMKKEQHAQCSYGKPSKVEYTPLSADKGLLEELL